jgi:hypothetical protein
MDELRGSFTWLKSVVVIHESHEKARYHVQRIGVMTKLPNEEGKNPAKNISKH